MKNEIKNTMLYIENITDNLGYKINSEDYYIEFLSSPHKRPTTLPKGYSAIYMFILNDKFLKIGKANSKSIARYCYQHYNVKSCISNLAKSLCNDIDFCSLDLNESNVGKWIQDNITRVNILIKNECGKATTELIESIFHYKFRPKYEGNI